VPSVALVSAIAGRTADGMELRLRSPWYRSLPLSCIDVELTVDGRPVDEDRISVHVNDRDYTLDELHERYDEFWFVLDAARVRVRDVAPGEHEVAVRLGLRIPYLFDEETGDVLQLWPAASATVAVPEQAEA
jgi:Domain of unknown function (DUF6379)